MSSTLARIDKKLYNQLQEFAFHKHRNARSAKVELEEAVKKYLTNQLKQEKKIKRGKTKNEKQKKNEE